MKRTMSIICAIAFFSLTISAQQNGNSPQKVSKDGEHRDMKKMVEMRAYQIANSLTLDDATTAKFTELYKSYIEELHAIRTKYNGNKGEIKPEHRGFSPKSMRTQPRSDKEVEERLLNSFKRDKEIAELKEKYYKKFRVFLNPKQIQKVYKTKVFKGKKNIKGKGFHKRGKKNQQAFNKGRMQRMKQHRQGMRTQIKS